jgi:uncharacterized protein (TIGR02118 family)
MIKRINVFPLAKGRDPEKVWEYWVKVHSQKVRRMPGLKKLVINRVIEIIPGPGGVKRDTNFWGLVEMWFDNLEDYNKAVESPEYLHKNDQFAEMVGEPPRLAFVEEKVVVE